MRPKCRGFFPDRVLPYRGLLSVFILAVVLSEASAAANYVRVQAELELVSHRSKGTNGLPADKRRTVPVVCVVGTNEWRIQMQFLRNAAEEWYADGTNVYRRHQINRDIPKPTTIPMPAVLPYEEAKDMVFLDIIPSPGGHPLGHLGVNIAWTAFCSGGYLRRPGRIIPLPTTIVRMSPDAFGYRDETEVFSDDLGLPQTIDLFTSKTLYLEGLQDERLTLSTAVARERRQQNVRWEDGQLRFHYEVMQATNFLAWTFPAEFAFAGYGPDGNGQWRKSVSGTGRLVSLSKSDKPPSLVEAIGLAKVTDYRFRHSKVPVEAIAYEMAAQAGLSPTNDPTLLAIFDAKVDRMKTALERKQPLQWFFTLILIGLLILPAIWIRTARARAKQ